MTANPEHPHLSSPEPAVPLHTMQTLSHKIARAICPEDNPLVGIVNREGRINLVAHMIRQVLLKDQVFEVWESRCKKAMNRAIESDVLTEKLRVAFAVPFGSLEQLFNAINQSRNVEKVCYDMHHALGINWGTDPYPLIGRLKRVTLAANQLLLGWNTAELKDFDAMVKELADALELKPVELEEAAKAAPGEDTNVKQASAAAATEVDYREKYLRLQDAVSNYKERSSQPQPEYGELEALWVKILQYADLSDKPVEPQPEITQSPDGYIITISFDKH
jgi:hypothetical protein